MEQADIDPSWLGGDEENYTIAEPEFRGVLSLYLIECSFSEFKINFTPLSAESDELAGESVWEVEHGRL